MNTHIPVSYTHLIGIWFVLAIGYFIAMPYLFDHVILAPCHNDFIFYDLLRHIGKTFDLTDDFFTQQFYVKLVNINLAAPFFIQDVYKRQGVNMPYQKLRDE